MDDKLYMISLHLLWLFPSMIGLAAVVLTTTEDARQTRHLRTLLMGGFAYMFCLYKFSSVSDNRCRILDGLIDPELGLQFIFFGGFSALVLYLLVILFRPSSLA